MFLRPFGLYCSACFGSLFVSIFCTCCGQFSWYCFISFTMFCAPVYSLVHWFFSLSSFVIPSKCLKNFICASSKRCSSLFFSTQASLPNFNAALTVMLWILNFVSLFIFFKCLRITLFFVVVCLQFVFYITFVFWYAIPQVFQSVTCSIILSFITIFTLCMCFPHIAIDFVFELDIITLFFFCYKV